tara:strand:+ start:33040 stop:33492 length:453 start_codon:yes stop_codon:yes gene_type:complete
MIKKTFLVGCVAAAVMLTGCASVKMESASADLARKEFKAPAPDMSAVYIYRDGVLGAALKKDIRVDGRLIGESAPNTYFFVELTPGPHTLATESEFSDNELLLEAEAGKNHFVEQYIRMGAFVGGANLRIVSEETGKAGVRSTKLASPVQ